MKPAPCNKRPLPNGPGPASQGGMGLVEAMVTLVLTAIIGMGMVYLTGRSAVAQKDTNVLGIAVGQMRDRIFSGQCGSASATSAPLSIGPAGGTAQSVSAQCESSSTTLQITSNNAAFTATNVSVPIPQISTNDDATSRRLFGGPVVMTP